MSTNTSVHTDDIPADDAAARRSVAILFVAGALGGAIASINIAISTLVGATLLSESRAFATLPATMLLFGTMCGTVPASLLSQGLGRRIAFGIGAGVGGIGGLVAAFAVLNGSFVGLLLGTFLTGGANAFVQQYRFAAADQASPAFRPKAVSWVLAGGIVAGVVGPQTVIRTDELIPTALYAGCYFAQCGLCLLAIPVLGLLRIPKPKPVRPGDDTGRSLGEIASSQPFVTAIVCGMFAYATMSLVMTAAPLAMQSFQHPPDASALGIQWHVIAMFAPSFFTGSLITRFGAERVVTAGFVLLAAAAVVGYLDTGIADFWACLVLLGVGWNLGFIGATSMLTGLCRPQERGRVQAFNDLLVFTGVAIASLSSGILLELVGWHVLLIVAAPGILISLGLLALKGARAAA